MMKSKLNKIYVIIVLVGAVFTSSFMILHNNNLNLPKKNSEKNSRGVLTLRFKGWNNEPWEGRLTATTIQRILFFPRMDDPCFILDRKDVPEHHECLKSIHFISDIGEKWKVLNVRTHTGVFEDPSADFEILEQKTGKKYEVDAIHIRDWDNNRWKVKLDVEGDPYVEDKYQTKFVFEPMK